MKRILCILLLLLLAIPAQAETLPDLTLVTPMPSPVPVPTEFACEAFIVNLPAGMELIEMQALEGYAAAIDALHPSAGQVQLAAVNADGSASLCFILQDSAQAVIEAAREAALQITGSADTAVETVFGVNCGASFRCTFENTVYSLHFFSNGSTLLLIASTGLEETQLDSMLTSLDF